MGQYDLSHGYPDDSASILADQAMEIPVMNDPESWEKIEDCVGRAIEAVQFAFALSVYRVSSTTINVRGGEYRYEGTDKTYVPGAAIDPTDNDTTYVWLTAANAVASGIDGDGWPSADHIPLAEVDADADGVITEVRDLRGRTWNRDLLTPRSLAGYDSTYGGATFVLTATLTAGSTVAVYTADAPFAFQVLDAWSVATSADGGTWKLTDGTDDITDAVAVTATDKTRNEAGTIDDAKHAIAKGGSLSVVGDGSLADVIVRVLCMRT